MERLKECIRIEQSANDAKAAVLMVYPAANPVGKAVVMCPGGGFNVVVTDVEGEAFVPWFGERGVTFAVLQYRMPEGHPEHLTEDIRWALQQMRAHAAAWGAEELGVMGASIGGYIAATAAVEFEGEERPAFQILIYPALSMLDEYAHLPSRGRMLATEHPDRATQQRLSLELHVTPDTPRAFIALAEDDPAVSPLNALRYYEALYANKVPASLHIYPRGGHSFAFKDSFPYKQLWLSELDRFLKE